MRYILVTGGAGFIGSHFVRFLLENYDYTVVNYDLLTYAGNINNIADLMGDPRHIFIRGDIRNMEQVERVMFEHEIDAVVNFAAESHVDRSIVDPGSFIRTDVYGTYVLLEISRRCEVERFLQVSTDEVYGSQMEGRFREDDPLDPSNPYSASKAGADLMARAYFKTFNLPVLITRGCNVVGPNQYPEKVVPLFTTNAIDDLPLPIYGDGRNVRDYIFVEDICTAIAEVLHKGEPGEAYNIGTGGENERSVLQVAETILDILDKPKSLIRFVEDRPGHDKRYPMDVTKVRSLGWLHQRSFEESLEITVRWYLENQSWWREIKAKDPWFRKRG
jgi:dTDP-glucose 4,6-dehydratase